MQPTTCLSLAILVSSLHAATAATITVTTTDNASTAGDGQTSLLEAIQTAVAGDSIHFNIPGAGPHTIVTPLGGYPLITAAGLTINGYSQPGATPNTNPILGGNNAQIKIILDSTGTDTAPNPLNASLPLRRSTRLDFPTFVGNTGYGTSENSILGVFEAENVTIRGLSFVARHTPGSDNDPSIYAVALVKEATNAHINGCWFGLPPGGSTMADLKPMASAVAAFRWRIGGDVFSTGVRIGTDGNGVNDRAEFNVMVGGHITLALELPAPRISGNYVNVFPNGTSFVDVEAIHQSLGALGASDSVENIENGRFTDDTVIGTNGDGVSDDNERNIFGQTVYDHHVEFYSNARRAVIAGNYFGVGVDGVTAAPLPASSQPDLFDLGGTASLRFGSNGDGVSDDLEGNVIWNTPGSRCVVSGSATMITGRGNRMLGNQFKATPFADGENASYAAYFAGALMDASLGAYPVITRYELGVIHGTVPAPNTANFPDHIIDVYLVDTTALANRTFAPFPMVHPRRLLASFRDKGAGDLNANANEFSFNLTSLALSPTALVAVAVSYSQDTGSFNAGRALTGPMSNPASELPVLTMRAQTVPGGQVELEWFGPPSRFVVQQTEALIPSNWFEIFGETYTLGRNVLTLGFESLADSRFYQLISR